MNSRNATEICSESPITVKTTHLKNNNKQEVFDDAIEEADKTKLIRIAPLLPVEFKEEVLDDHTFEKKQIQNFGEHIESLPSVREMNTARPALESEENEVYGQSIDEIREESDDFDNPWLRFCDPGHWCDIQYQARSSA